MFAVEITNGRPPVNLHCQEAWHRRRLSSVDEIASVIETVLAVMIGLRYAPKVIFAARLALEEAICNSIKHGHQYDPSKVVEVRYAVQPNQVLIEVEDEGAGFDPSQIRDATTPENLDRPCGRGLLLIRHYTAWVRHNRRGNCIIFCSEGFPSVCLPLKIRSPTSACEISAPRGRI
jgi:serine/threonine-protein kinase RsbW